MPYYFKYMYGGLVIYGNIYTVHRLSILHKLLENNIVQRLMINHALPICFMPCFSAIRLLLHVIFSRKQL